MTEPGVDSCVACGRGREACEYCHDVAEVDYQAMCDCGLHDFGHHLNACRERDPYRWVIAADHLSAQEPREP